MDLIDGPAPLFLVYFQIGDRIIEVDGVDLRHSTHERAVEVIQAAGNPVRLLVQSLVHLVRPPHDQENIDVTTLPPLPFHSNPLSSINQSFESLLHVCIYICCMRSFARIFKNFFFLHFAVLLLLLLLQYLSFFIGTKGSVCSELSINFSTNFLQFFPPFRIFIVFTFLKYSLMCYYSKYMLNYILVSQHRLFVQSHE